MASAATIDRRRVPRATATFTVVGLILAGCSQADPDVQCFVTGQALEGIVSLDGEVEVTYADFSTETMSYPAALRVYADGCF